MVKQDTDGDNKLTSADKSTLAVSDAAGLGYKELIFGVDHLYATTMRDAKILEVLYRSGTKKYVASVDLVERTVISTTEMPRLGGEVE